MAGVKRRFAAKTTGRRGNQVVSIKAKVNKAHGNGTRAVDDDDPDSEDDEEEEEEEDIADLHPAPPAALRRLPSSDARQMHKALVQARKAAKPNSENTQQLKVLWERVRRKSNIPKDERKDLVEKALAIMSGHIKEYVYKHDTGRILQTVVRYGTPEQHQMIVKELKGRFVVLTENRYSEFFVEAMFKAGDANIKRQILSEYHGNVMRLMRHPRAWRVLDVIYRELKGSPRLLSEWYGHEFALLPDSTILPTLGDILRESPEKRGPIMRQLFENISRMVEKRRLTANMVHDAMMQYITNLDPRSEEMRAFLDLITDEDIDFMGLLPATCSGSTVVCYALAVGTAKDRKIMLRELKNHIANYVTQSASLLIVPTIFETVDDTVLVNKMVLAPLLHRGTDPEEQDEVMFQAAIDPYGYLPLIYIPSGGECLRDVSTLGRDGIAMLEKVVALRSITSKKDPSVRRQELLAAISPALIRVIETRAGPLLRESRGSRFATEVLLGCVGDKTEALEAIADAMQGDPNAEGHPLSQWFCGKMLKTLVSGGRFNVTTQSIDYVEPRLHFYNVLYPRIQPYIVEWATGPGSFVVIALVEAADFASKDEVLAKLGEKRELLKEVASENKGTALLLKKLKPH